MSLRLGSELTGPELRGGATRAREAGFRRIWPADNPFERSSPISVVIKPRRNPSSTSASVFSAGTPPSS
ncbi:hypothetical protein HBB16_20270 [Pseudonocardia sp. MCCB 268]|nr:hypothetical protein [Pseudonocardia cytotoxica]